MTTKQIREKIQEIHEKQIDALKPNVTIAEATALHIEKQVWINHLHNAELQERAEALRPGKLSRILTRLKIA